MKLLKEGNYAPPEWEKEFHCIGHGKVEEGSKGPCYSLWQLTVEDIVEKDMDIFGLGGNKVYGFVCPKCGCFTQISANHLPDKVIRKNSGSCSSEAYLSER